MRLPSSSHPQPAIEGLGIPRRKERRALARGARRRLPDGMALLASCSKGHDRQVRTGVDSPAHEEDRQLVGVPARRYVLQRSVAQSWPREARGVHSFRSVGSKTQRRVGGGSVRGDHPRSVSKGIGLGASNEKTTETQTHPAASSRDGFPLRQETEVGIGKAFDSSNVLPKEGASDRLYIVSLHGGAEYAVLARTNTS